MDLRGIRNLIKLVVRSGVSEVKLEMEGVKITIKTNPDESGGEQIHVQQLLVAQQLTQLPIQQPLPIQTLPVVTPETTENKSAPSEDSKYITIKSPVTGTSYRRPGPDKPLFIEVGLTISKGSVVHIIEAMRLFNEIESEAPGRIVKILVDDSSLVEFDQPLYLVDPS